MLYLLDTVTVIRHFSGVGKIGKEAYQLLKRIEENKDSAAISIISLMEIMYLSEKLRIQISLTETLEIIDKASNYNIIDLTTEILQTALLIDFDELHDRLIIATAKYLDIPILSSDQRFTKIQNVETIWN